MNTSSLPKIGGGKSNRRSNMEALRIVAMSMIVIHHFFIHGLASSAVTEAFYPLLKGFVYSGVDIFFLISGYFLIRFSVRSLVRFYIMVTFFSLVNMALLFGVGEMPTIRQIIKLFIWPVAGSYYWFVSIYLLLMVTSPILNAGLKAMTRRQLERALLIMLATIVLMRGHYASYNYLNGMMMYVIGYYIAAYKPERLFSRWALLAGFIACCAIMSGIQYLYMKFLGRTFGGFDSYDNPFILLSAILLSMYFAKLEFQKRWVNSLAGAAFGCYLLQDGIFGFRWFYGWQNRFVTSHGYGLDLTGMLAMCFAGYWIVSWLLTEFLNLWIRPVSDSIYKVSRSLFYKAYNLITL